MTFLLFLLVLFTYGLYQSVRLLMIIYHLSDSRVRYPLTYLPLQSELFQLLFCQFILLIYRKCPPKRTIFDLFIFLPIVSFTINLIFFNICLNCFIHFFSLRHIQRVNKLILLSKRHILQSRI